tara:strand:+ start:1399 stop:2475 length:1077 start_codon:yes stop_codon:yes gene_type:complete
MRSMKISSNNQSLEKTSDLHVVETRPLIPPRQLHQDLSLDYTSASTVSNTRNLINNILHKNDSRFLVIVGPCSIHDIDAAKEYSNYIQQFRKNFSDKLEIVMRVYFEKPRTTIGWKGLINDPHLDGSYDINTGLRRARELLLYLANAGIPSATELLDPIVPQYIADLISWTAIGARTTESQTHREMASGLSMPIGFKNGTDGSVNTAINAMQSASRSHHFLGVNCDGCASIVNTTGNPDTHIVLRGGAKGPNFDNYHITNISSELIKNNLPQKVMIDCSHGNSNKDFRKQSEVLDNISKQLKEGEKNILGVMLESHLKEGNQKLTKKSELEYGKSITDACIDINTTHDLLSNIYKSIN